MAVIFHWTRDFASRKTDVIDLTIEYITLADADAVVILIVNNALVCASDKDPPAVKTQNNLKQKTKKTQIHANVNA